MRVGELERKREREREKERKRKEGETERGGRGGETRRKQCEKEN